MLRARFYVSLRLNGEHETDSAWARSADEAVAIVRHRLRGCGRARVLSVDALPDALIDGEGAVTLLRTEAERRAAVARLAGLLEREAA